jgi:hypothetical protein
MSTLPQRVINYSATLGSALAAAMTALSLSACALTQVASGPQRIALDARPNGIAVSPRDGRIFITDDKTNSLLSSTDGKKFEPFAAIPVVAGQANALSQVAVSDTGALLVERFGFGTAGAVIKIDADKSVSILSGLDPARRRLGLAVVSPGKLLSTWFVKNGNAPATGGVSLITYDQSTHAATEHTVLSGLAKPVGVVVKGDAVFISDQGNNMILKTNLAGLINHTQAGSPEGGLSTTVIKINGPDLLTIDATGTLYTKCNATAVCKIDPGNAVAEIAKNFEDARGLAINESNESKRLLLVIDRAKSASGVSSLRTIPLN